MNFFTYWESTRYALALSDYQLHTSKNINRNNDYATNLHYSCRCHIRYGVDTPCTHMLLLLQPATRREKARASYKVLAVTYYAEAPCVVVGAEMRNRRQTFPCVIE